MKSIVIVFCFAVLPFLSLSTQTCEAPVLAQWSVTPLDGSLTLGSASDTRWWLCSDADLEFVFDSNNNRCFLQDSAKLKISGNNNVVYADGANEIRFSGTGNEFYLGALSKLYYIGPNVNTQNSFFVHPDTDIFFETDSLSILGTCEQVQINTENITSGLCASSASGISSTINELDAYFFADELHINNALDDLQLTVVDLSGRLIYSEKLSAGKRSIVLDNLQGKIAICRFEIHNIFHSIKIFCP